MLPEDFAVIVQHHRPCIPLQPFLGRAGGVQLQAARRLRQRTGQRFNAGAVLLHIAVV